MFDKIGDIKTWLSLFAFIGAIIVTYFIKKNVSDRKKLEAVPENQRSSLIEATAEKLRLDLNSIPKSDRTKIIQQALKNRIYQQVILAVTLLLAGIIIAYIAIANMKGDSITSGNKDLDSSHNNSNDNKVGLTPPVEPEVKTYLKESLVAYRPLNLYHLKNNDKPYFDYFPMRSVEGKFIICGTEYNNGTVDLHPKENIPGEIQFKIPQGAKSFHAIAGLVKSEAEPNQIGDVVFRIYSITRLNVSSKIAEGHISDLCGQKNLHLEIGDNLVSLKIEIDPNGTNWSDHFALVNAYFSNKELAEN